MLNLKHDVAQKGALRKQAGFTLIELLIVIAIIAILAAIAIPQFLKYKQGAYLDSAKSDVKNAVTAMEAFNAQYGDYPTATTSCDGTTTATQCDLKDDSTNTSTKALNISKGNKITIDYGSCANGVYTSGTSGTVNAYEISGYSNQIGSSDVGGSNNVIKYNSCTGVYTNF